MREIVGRESFDVVLLAIVQPVRHPDEKDVERLPCVHQRDRMALMVIDRDSGRRHGPVDVGTSGQHAKQGESRSASR